jgi:PBP1b-binding outer membrane lipoprotein LpoB
MRHLAPILCAAVVLTGCATMSPAPLAKGKTKAEALAAYGKPHKINVTSMGENWEYTDVLVKSSTGNLVKMKLLVISFDRKGKVMCWPCEFSVRQ